MMKAIYEGLKEGLRELMKEKPEVFLLTNDLGSATSVLELEKEFPERYLNMGVSDQDMIGCAAGLALSGKVPFITSFSLFICGRSFDQIRNLICKNSLNVNFVGTHPGVSVGRLGGGFQIMEDLAIMLSLIHI